MEEVASILSLVLSNTTSENSKVKYSIQERALAEAHKRVADLCLGSCSTLKSTFHSSKSDFEKPQQTRANSHDHDGFAWYSD